MRFLFLLIVFGVSLQTASFAQKNALKKADEMFEYGRFELAAKNYEVALQEKPESVYILSQLAYCHVYLFRGKEAIPLINKAIELDKKGDVQLKYIAARAYHLNHQFDKAAVLYKEADPTKANYRDTSKKIKECENGKRLVGKPTNVKITNVGSVVNSKYDDLLPKTTADLSLLYFTSHRPGSIGGPINPEDIYKSKNKGGAWDTPEQLKAPINTSDNDACVGLSPDGQTMFLFKGSNGGDIYSSDLEGDTWTEPKPLTINTSLKETSVTISPDGRELFFDRKADGGTFNIYWCRKNASGRWSKPVKVPGINSSSNNRAPFMHPDGQTLFFSSEGFNSMGGYDVFKTTKTESGGWSKPANLGYPINTAGDELCFILSADGRLGFYASTKDGGYGGQDIYSIRMPPSKKPQLALVKGKVTEGASNKPVEAKIIVTDNDADQVVGEYKSNSETGDYLISLPAGKNYGISIEKEGHLFHSENVYLAKNADYKSLKKNITLVDAQPGAKVVLNNIFFESGSYSLSKSSNSELKNLVRLLKQNPTIRIEISGHTDNVGDAVANQGLSTRRAKSVVDYLVTKGIPSSRLEYKGYGSKQPVASNDTPIGRQKNRRTEFKIIE